MNIKLTPARVLAAAIVVLSAWIVHGFIQALLAASITAIASWPLYEAFVARLPRRIGRSAAAALFTGAITVFLLAPLVFAGWALLGEARSLLADVAGSEWHGIPLPRWLMHEPLVAPLAGPPAAAAPAAPTLPVLTPHADPAALFGWAQSLGEFTARHVLMTAFTVLLLAFFYRNGTALAGQLMQALRHAVGDRAERYVAVATRAVRASVSSMLVVGLFDACITGLAYAAAGAPRPLVWGAITGSLAAVPFLGYATVLALAAQLALERAATPALISLVLGCGVLLCGDKIVRPLVARGGMRLPFVWVLMGCVGGFGVLGLAGLVVGPVVLSLASELWQERGRAME